MRTNVRSFRRFKKEDRLSELHDDLLIHILSFLDAKSATRTCRLSKRWNKSFWIYHPDLYFDSQTFDENSYDFENFVNRMLTQRDNLNCKLRSFCFHWTFTDKIPQRLLDKVHSYALSHDVEHFNLRICCLFGDIMYPSKKFDPISLTTLQLNLSNGYTSIPNDDSYLKNLYLTGCTSLKTLWLQGFNIEIESHCLDLFSSLLNLTELVIIGCKIVGRDRYLHVGAPRLERLTLLENVDHLGREIHSFAPHCVISSPTLKYMRIHLWHSIFSLSQLSHIEELEINFHPYIKRKSDTSSSQARTVIRIINCLSHAKSVTLSKSTLQIISAFVNVIWEFPYMQLNWKLLKVIRTMELPASEFPEYLKGLSYLSKHCSENLRVEEIR